jgi:hypothetical protein
VDSPVPGAGAEVSLLILAAALALLVGAAFVRVYAGAWISRQFTRYLRWHATHVWQCRTLQCTASALVGIAGAAVFAIWMAGRL